MCPPNLSFQKLQLCRLDDTDLRGIVDGHVSCIAKKKIKN